MAMNVINIFKAIKIDKHHRFHVAIATLADALQLFNQRTAVGQMAQPVGQRNFSRLAFPARQLPQA